MRDRTPASPTIRPAAAAAIDRPVQRDAAPGLRVASACFTRPSGSSPKALRDVAPRPAEAGGGVRSDQLGEFVGAEREAAVGIGLPHEAQRMAPRIRPGSSSRRRLARVRRDGALRSSLMCRRASSADEGAASSAIASTSAMVRRQRGGWFAVDGAPRHGSASVLPAQGIEQRERGRRFARVRRFGRDRRDELATGGSWFGNSSCGCTSAAALARRRDGSAMQRRGIRHDQRDEADVGASADALQHLRPTSIAVATRPASARRARIVETGLDQIVKAEQGRAHRCADQDAVTVNAATGIARPSTRRCSRSVSGWRGPVAGDDQNAVAAIGQIEPRTAAGHEHAGRRAKTAQPLHPDRAVRRQPAGEPRDLAAMRIGGTENFWPQAPCCRPRRTRARRPDWPTESACRRPTTAMRAGRSSRAPPAADRVRLPLEFRFVHRGCRRSLAG